MRTDKKNKISQKGITDTLGRHSNYLLITAGGDHKAKEAVAHRTSEVEIDKGNLRIIVSKT